GVVREGAEGDGVEGERRERGGPKARSGVAGERNEVAIAFAHQQTVVGEQRAPGRDEGGRKRRFAVAALAEERDAARRRYDGARVKRDLAAKRKRQRNDLI